MSGQQIIVPRLLRLRRLQGWVSEHLKGSASSEEGRSEIPVRLVSVSVLFPPETGSSPHPGRPFMHFGEETTVCWMYAQYMMVACRRMKNEPLIMPLACQQLSLALNHSPGSECDRSAGEIPEGWRFQVSWKTCELNFTGPVDLIN